MRHFNDDTICAISTPPGQGAIAVIRVSGPDTITITEAIFQPKASGKSLSDADGHTIHFGDIRDGENLIDEVLVSLFRRPSSYTGEDVVEISCHGSTYIQEQIIQLLIRKGCRHAQPGEFTLRAFTNGKFDLSQAEAVADLIASSSKRSHDLALEQMRGGYSAKIRSLRQRLLDFTSLIELELDFSEEDVEFANREELMKLLEEIKTETGELASSFSVGNVLKRGIPVAIIGEPNVGKSTLLNAILNEERAIVSEIPGTTRDTIEDTVIVNNYAFRFIDTAGLRHSNDRIESIGIERTYEKIAQAAIILYVFDVSTADCDAINEKLEEFDSQLRSTEAQEHRVSGAQRYGGDVVSETENQEPGTENFHSRLTTHDSRDKKFILIANKMDQLIEAPKKLKEFLEMDCLFVSAKRKENIHLILDSLLESVVELDLQDNTMVSNIRHYEALTHTLGSIENIISGLQEGIPSDLLTVDIRTALHHLGEITGEVTTDEVLGNIFSRFCIGK